MNQTRQAVGREAMLVRILILMMDHKEHADVICFDIQDAKVQHSFVTTGVE